MEDFYSEFVRSSYKNYIAQQHPNTWEIFEYFLQEENFDLIIEIGTGLGGLTEFIHDLGHKIISYDIGNSCGTHDRLFEKGLDIRHKNLFISDYTILDNELIDLLKNGKILVLCDGLEKAKEINLISKYIKSGDIIMAHDYCVDVETFETLYKGKEWRFLELVESDINAIGLTPYKQDTFKEIFWVCKIKNK